MTRMMIGTEDGRTPANWAPGIYHGGPHPWSTACEAGPACVPVDPNHVEEEPLMAKADWSKPNHFFHDSLGDPATCTGDHNHPPEPDTTAPRTSALNEARNLITGDRNNQYGPPTQDFQRTAALLNALGYRRVDAVADVQEIKPSDVAIIIAQVKVSRLMHSRGKRDSWVDLAGYAGCGYECAVEEENGHA